MIHSMRSVAFLLIVVLLATGCTTGQRTARHGDEIVIAGQYFRTGAPVVLWTDPGGYDAYRTDRRFAPLDEASFLKTAEKIKDIDSPDRYNTRRATLTPQELEKVRGGGWDLNLVQEKIDQFVIHYDVCGISRTCFKVLHDMRGLSVHFMLDIDGTIYQTLDVKERAWHAGEANTRSVGIEIANMGAYSPNQFKPLAEWYSKDQNGRTFITIPARLGDGGLRNPGQTLRPARNDMITGTVQGSTLTQHDLTPQQYDSLIKLTATLGTVLPRITVDYPKDDSGAVLPIAFTKEQLATYNGLLAHWHVTTQKSDPGPAFQWEKVTKGARSKMTPWAKSRNNKYRGQYVPTTQPTTRP